MTIEERNEEIIRYIDKMVEDVNRKYPGAIDNEKREMAINLYINSGKDLEEIKKDIDENIDEIIMFEEEKKKQRKEEEEYQLNTYNNEQTMSKVKMRTLTKKPENSGYINTYILIIIIIAIVAISVGLIILLNK